MKTRDRTPMHNSRVRGHGMSRLFRGKPVWVGLCGTAIFAAVLALLPSRDVGRARPRPTQTASSQNLASNDGYVGSKVCAECHGAIYSKFSQTDMGRSMSLASPKLLETFPNSAHIFEAKLNRHFDVFVNEGNLYQADYEIGVDGKELFRDTQKVEWIIGSGANGFGAIVRRGEYLFEAPLSFYSKTQHWALSPGYETYDYGFSRPILPGCIVCHSGRPQAIDNGNGRFLDPPFKDLSIGCENCHGPGASHAWEMREIGPSPDAASHSIVNPAKLPSWLADNICASCHQTGDARVLKAGKNYQDFRPGSALDDTIAILMVPPRRDSPPQGDLLEHYFSMTLSKCYEGSGSRLSCITCHDPHVQPTKQEASMYFRLKCLSCHTEKSCAVPLAIRQRKNPPDDCSGCHMPKREVKEISHSMLTNHRIIRDSGESYPDRAFHMTTPALPDLIHVSAIPGQKDVPLPSITLLQAYGQLIGGHPEYRERYFALAEKLRRSAPDNISVLEALAYGALQTKQNQGTSEAIEYLNRAINRGSTSPGDFEQCAGLLMSAGRQPEAADLLQQGIKIIPHDGELYRLLATSYLSQNKNREASDVLTHASQIFPENIAIRALLKESQNATQKN
jgi:hemin uptake protein HemP